MSQVLLCISLLAVGFASLGCRRNELRPNAIRPEWGVILPAEEAQKLPGTCVSPIPMDLSGRWDPARADIDRLEKRLPDVLETALARVILEEGETLPQSADYYRQYAGTYHMGRRAVYVCGLHRTIVELLEPQLWAREAVGVDDGGIAVFGLVYDVDADAFGPIQFEGRFSGSVRMRRL